MRRLGSLALLLLLPLAASAQAVPAPTTTTLTSSSMTLQLPGTLKLTATVAPPAATAGMPTGNISFLNGAVSLGTAALAPIPSTANFSAPAIAGSFGLDPFGLFTLPSGTAGYAKLGMLDWYYVPASGIYYPEVTMFSGRGANLFQTSAVTQIPPSSGFTYGLGSIDGYAIGDFNHDGVTDLLLHGSNGDGNQFYVLPGTSAGGFDPTTAVISFDNAPTGCSCIPTEAITTADFNEDGYPDIAYAVTSSGATSPIGVALNGGAASPGTFQTYDSAPAVTDAAGDTFYPTAITSGHFTSSGHVDLVVAGYFYSSTTGIVLPGDVVVFPGKGDGTFGAPVIFGANAGTTAPAVTTADLRGNGMTDVVVAEQVYSATAGIRRGPTSMTRAATPATPTNNVEVFLGDGQGGLTASSTVPLSVAPASVTIADYNGDGYPDILVTGTDGSLNVILNDGTGQFSTATAIGTAPNLPVWAASSDFNADGLPDIVEVTRYSSTGTVSAASELLNSASAQASINTPPQSLPAGNDTLRTSYAGDVNFTGSSSSLTVTVTQTVPTITWPPVAAIQNGTPLSATQLNATANVPGTFTYTPAAGTVLPLGNATLQAIFAPTDSFDYSGAAASQTVSVVPASATAQISTAASVAAGQNSTVTLTISPYPSPLTATLTLSFTPDPPNTVTDPAVLFPNNSSVDVIQIPANSSAAIPPIAFSTGSTAGKITISVKLVSNGTDVTPSSLTPAVVTVPASPPVISSVTLTRNGTQMTVAILGLSSTRDVTQAQFHFTPAAGHSLSTTDVTVQLSTEFSAWYGSASSANFGTMFLYTQPFSLDSDASSVGSVSVTLTNSQGQSQPGTAQ